MNTENDRPLRIKTFSATLARDREDLGDKVSDWIAERDITVVELRTLLSSDSAYHCLTIIVIYRY